MTHRVGNRDGFPHGISPGDRLQYKPNRPALDAGVGIREAGMNVTNPSAGKFKDKELMHGLNDRLAGFIEKVHHLEYQNHLLEREIEELRGKAKPASCLEEEYGPELRKLRQLVQDITQQKHHIEIEHANLEDELSNVRGRHEEEARSRSDAESNVALLKKDISDAYQAKLQLDRKAQALVDEIHFLKRNHEAEVSEMFDQIQDAQVTVRAHDFGNPGVTAALRDIRAQLEGHSASDFQQVGETFRSQFARLTQVAETKREALRTSQQEIQEYRRSMQAKNIELDCAKGTREALERQLHDVEDRHKEEMIHYQNTIKELENELISCKFDMSGYLREYQDLFNVKMALDVEILSYRKLLCGEEARLSAMSDAHISLPYIYHQSPVYTLPCFSRPGGPHRRAEPHYKFVEEIITETTREIEMSEFEETGSEETEVGRDEMGCDKRDRGASEEEMDDKDGREEDGEPMPDSEQIEVASLEVDDSDKGEKSKEEAVGNEGESDTDTTPQEKVLLSESPDEKENEQHKAGAENTEAAVTKADDLKAPVGEGPLKKSDDGNKGDAEKDLSAQVKKPVDETSVLKEKTDDVCHTLVSEESDKTLFFTAETKSVLHVETKEPLEKAQALSSTITKSGGKENGLEELKEMSKSDAVKGEDKVAKNIQDVNHDSNKGQDKESGETNLPVTEDQKQNSGDKVQTESPKEKTTDNADIKDLHQGAPESSKAQKAKLSDVSEKIQDPGAKSEKAESSKSEK